MPDTTDDRPINVGDRIRFKAVTRWGDKPATRKVVGFDSYGRPLVRFGGWDEFIVRRGEILAVEAA